jgi:hypothetical protein
MLSPPVLKLISFLAPSLALTTSTSILSYSIFLAPTVLTTADQSTSLALKQVVYYFRAGKPIFPTAAILNTILYAILAYDQPSKRLGYSVAAAGSGWVIGFSAVYLIPVTNDRILELEDMARKGGEEAVKGKREEVKSLLGDFTRENWLRGGVYWLGGMVGLWTLFQ